MAASSFARVSAAAAVIAGSSFCASIAPARRSASEFDGVLHFENFGIAWKRFPLGGAAFDLSRLPRQIPRAILARANEIGQTLLRPLGQCRRITMRIKAPPRLVEPRQNGGGAAHPLQSAALGPELASLLLHARDRVCGLGIRSRRLVPVARLYRTIVGLALRLPPLLDGFAESAAPPAIAVEGLRLLIEFVERPSNARQSEAGKQTFAGFAARSQKLGGTFAQPGAVQSECLLKHLPPGTAEEALQDRLGHRHAGFIEQRVLATLAANEARHAAVGGLQGEADAQVRTTVQKFEVRAVAETEQGIGDRRQRG